MTKYSLFYILIFFISSCKSIKDRDVIKRDILGIDYLTQYIEKYKGDSLNYNIRSFNFLYNSLSLHRLVDSSLVFICNREKAFVIKFSEDSLLIFREHSGSAESKEKQDFFRIYFGIRDHLKKGQIDSIPIVLGPSYLNIYEVKQGFGDELVYRAIWEAADNSKIIHYKFEYCWAYMRQYSYEKTIKNDYINFDLLKNIPEDCPRCYLKE